MKIGPLYVYGRNEIVFLFDKIYYSESTNPAFGCFLTYTRGGKLNYCQGEKINSSCPSYSQNIL